MEKLSHTADDVRSNRLQYVWPAPVGVLLWLAAHFLGREAFLMTHFWFEIGIVVSMLASIVYSIRLFPEERRLVPRWVFVLNFCFGPTIITGIMILGLFKL